MLTRPTSHNHHAKLHESHASSAAAHAAEFRSYAVYGPHGFSVAMCRVHPGFNTLHDQQSHMSVRPGGDVEKNVADFQALTALVLGPNFTSTALDIGGLWYNVSLDNSRALRITKNADGPFRVVVTRPVDLSLDETLSSLGIKTKRTFQPLVNAAYDSYHKPRTALDPRPTPVPRPPAPPAPPCTGGFCPEGPRW